MLGPILTPNNNSSLSYDFKFEQAIATRGEEIIFVGSEDNLKKQEGLIGENTTVIKLSDDQIVIPGFQVYNIKSFFKIF